MGDRWCWEERQPKGRCQAMTAFKSDGAMHLRGKAAKRWVMKIKAEKADQDKREREAKTRSEKNRSAG